MRRTPSRAPSSALRNSSPRAERPSPSKTTIRVAGETPNSSDITFWTLSASEFEPSKPPPFRRPERSGAKNALEITSTTHATRIAHRKRWARWPRSWKALISVGFLKNRLHPNNGTRPSGRDWAFDHRRLTGTSGSWRCRDLARQGQGEDQADYGQARYDQHSDREADVVGEQAEQRRAEPPEPDGEPHGDAGGEPDAAWQILLPHD